jgi:hypothetical protein
MPRPKKAEVIEESIRLSSEVTVIVRASATVYDTLSIQRVGGVATVALQGATPVPLQYPPQAGVGQYVPPSGTPNLDAARASLEAQFLSGPIDASVPTQRDIVSPASLGLPSAEALGLLGGSGEFIGRSNEDTE